MKKLVRLLSGLFIILVFIAAITFSYINSTPVKISFGSWEFQEVPVSAWIIAAFVVGGFLGLGLGLGIWRNFRSKSEIKRLQKQLANSQQEVIKLRAISIKDLQ
jgi:putative membrane protein